LIVNFTRFGGSSLDIMVYAFTLTRAWADYQTLKQELLLGIGRIIERHGAEIAFPTQTLHMVTGGDAPEPSEAAQGRHGG
ncbi:MAG: mechanosensitive ion channel family protein, partial [Hydrogenophaga sp.]|nr:mechanosensitive ion channel family protein [Hydrogenophaga sp.]